MTNQYHDTRCKRELLLTQLNSMHDNLTEDIRTKCIKYATDPNIPSNENVDKLLKLFDIVRDSYLVELDELQSNYEVRLKTILLMIAGEINKVC